MATRTSLHAGLLLAGVLAAAPAGAAPGLLGYQGRLLRADGTAATGTASVTFAVFDAVSGGTALWNETQTLGLSDGYYATFLGLVTPAPDGLFDGGARWLEVRVGSETLLPRQQIAAVAYAETARNVGGGSANVLSLRVGGQTVIDAAGRLAGPARYSAGPGIAVDDASQLVSLRACAAGQTLVRDSSSWQCAVAGTLTGLDAAAPLSVGGPADRPLISLARAGAASNGYLVSSEWNAFDAKYGAATACGGDLSGTLGLPVVARLQTRPVADDAPSFGDVLKWTGAEWEPSKDSDSGGTVRDVRVSAPLTAYNGSSVPEISLAAAGQSADGYLTSVDWARFEAKYGAATQCGGDLDGALAAPVVAAIRGVEVASAAPGLAQVLRFDGSRWAPASLGIDDVGGLSGGYLDLSGAQTIGGTKTFTDAPVFGAPLGVASGGTGAKTASPNAVFAGPATGSSAAAPEFRSLAAADLPDLDASRITGGTLAVARGGTGTSNAFPAGSILFAGDSGAYSHSASLRWDNTNGRLGIGTGTPSSRLDVQGGDVNVSGAVFAGGSVHAAGFVGNLVGDVTGSVLGNVTGNVTGSLAGNVVGDTAGTHTGPVFGNVAGNLTGNVTGNLVGYVKLTASAPEEAGMVRFAGGHFQGFDGSRWLNLDNVPPPVVTSVTPASGPGTLATPITVHGSNFQSLATVHVGDVPCTDVNVVNTTTITASAPANATTGAKDVKVTNPDFQTGTLPAAFTYNQPPTVASVSPSSGPNSGGTLVTVTGTNFLPGATVTVGGVDATAVTVTSDTTITATTGASTNTGAKEVRVTHPDTQSGALANGFTYLPPPYGSGKDGSVMLSGTVSFARTRLASNAVAGAASLGVNSAAALSVAAGDLLLVVDLRGSSSTGTWETVEVASSSGNTVNLAGPLANAYLASDLVMVQKVPQYANVALSGTVTSAGFDGSGGGVFAVAAGGTLSFSGGSISMDGKGYRGNATTSGESWNGPGCAESGTNNGGCTGGVPVGCRLANQGGGGGIFDTPANPEPSSGGGGYGTAGGNGNIDSSSSCYGQGGGTYGDANLAKIFFGSAGGCLTPEATMAGSGGGIVILLARTISGFNTVSSRGTAGSGTHHQAAGGGAGGAVYVKADMAGSPLDSSKIVVAGGAGGCRTDAGSPGCGGAGGSGRSKIVYVAAPTAPVSDPPPAVASVSPTSGTRAGGTLIAVTGSNFVAGATVTVGGVACTGVTVTSTTSLTATTGASPDLGAKEVRVTNPDMLSGAMANAYTYLQAVYGTGKDGSPTLSGTVSFARTRLASNAGAGATSLSVTSAAALSLANGDLLLVVDLQGSSATGTWELVEVASSSGNTVNLVAALANAYVASDVVSVQKVPQYANATLSGTVTAGGWDGSGGGVFAVAASGTLNFSGGSISMDGKGYRGNASTSGESWNGPGCAAGSTNDGQCYGATPRGCRLANNGGGGGIFDTPANPEPSSGGGGYGTAGANGYIDSSSSCYGVGGAAYGDANLAKIHFGSAGGCVTPEATSAGSGGGIVIVLAKTISGWNTVSSRGTGGAGTHHQAAGGGAGGAVYVKADMAGSPLDSSKIVVTGGAGGTRTDAGSCGCGGAGGSGRSRIVYYP